MTEAAFDAVNEALREQLTELLRRVRPRVIFCYVAGEKRKMDTGGPRAVRYSQLARVIVAMGSTLERCDLCNAKGELIESWHPRGALVEDEPAEEAGAVPALSMPAGLAALPAEMVGQVLQLCIAFSQQVQLGTQRAVDHAVDRHSAGQKVLLAGFSELLKATHERLGYIERQQTQSFKLVQKSLEMQSDARSVALDAQRLAESGEDPNSPDAIAADFARRFMERQLGGAGAGSTGEGTPAGAQSRRKLATTKDTDEN